MKELWQPVEGYEGLYEVSDQGQVRSLDRLVEKQSKAAVWVKMQLKGRCLKPQMNGNVRLHVSLRKNGKTTTHKVHRLVARAFIGVCPDGLQVNHLDGDPQNNSVSNLEYCTASENMKHAVREGLITPPTRRPCSKVSPRPHVAA